MRVMLTGATGFLGGHLLARLRQHGVGMTALVRSGEAARRLSASGVEAVQGSIEDPASLRAALAQPTDAIFHVAADTSPWRGHRERQTRTNVEGTRHVIEAAQSAGVRRLVHVSSVSAFGQQDGVLTESSARLGKESWINYERTKAIAGSSFRSGRARPASRDTQSRAYPRPGDTNTTAARMFLLIDQGKLPGAPPGSGAFADVREVAAATVAAWRHPRHGEQFLLGGSHASFLELVQTIAVELGRKAPSRPMPAGFLRGYARVLEAISRVTGSEPQLTPEAVSFTCHHLQVDSAKAMRDLDYRTTPLDVLVRDTCHWLRDQGMLLAR